MHNNTCLCVSSTMYYFDSIVKVLHIPIYPQILHVFNKSPSELIWTSLSVTPKLCKINN